jgi:hypothetical protein
MLSLSLSYAVNLIVAAVEGNAVAQDLLRNEATRGMLEALLRHPVKAMCHQGLLLMSHVVWCHPDNQVWAVPPVEALCNGKESHDDGKKFGCVQAPTVIMAAMAANGRQWGPEGP